MRPMLIVSLFLMFAFGSSAHATPSEQGMFFRVLVSGVDAEQLTMTGEILPTRKKPIHLDTTLQRHQASDRFLSPWMKMDLVLDDAGDMIDHAIVVALTEAGEPVESMQLTFELVGGEAAAQLPDPDIRLALTQDTLGHTNTILIPAGDPALTWRDARWLSDHIQYLDDALAAAGYTEPIKIDGISYEAELNLRRFGDPVLTDDPRLVKQLGDILARVGFNRSNRTGYLANPEHFNGYLSRMHLGHDHAVYAPMDDDVKAALPGFWQEYNTRWDAGGMFEDLPKPAVLKLGDEISRLRKTDQLRQSPFFNQLVLEEAKIVTGDDPTRLGLASWDELEVPKTLTRDKEMRTPEEVPADQRLLMYIVLRAANRATADMYAQNTAAVHEYVDPSIRTTVNLLGVLYGGGYSRLAWWHMTPDYFRMADQHAVDLLQVQAAVPFYPPSGPLTMSLMMPALAKQAADRNPQVGAEVMHFGARVEPAAYEHLFMSTLGSGVDHITTYRFGLKATGWEWFDAPSKVNEFARMGRMLAALGPFVAGAQTPTPEVAVLHAESSDLWSYWADSRSKAEVRGPWFAMRFAGVPVDTLREYMVEDGELDKYKLLFVGQRNVNRRVQEAILAWVRDGGTLVLLPGAMAFDGGDQPSDVVTQALGNTIRWPGDQEPPRHYNEFGTHGQLTVATFSAGVGEVPVRGYALPVAGDGEVLATYADGTVAARIARLGRGEVIGLGFSPSISYLSGAAKSKAAWREMTIRDDAVDESVVGATREGAPYWLEANIQGSALFRALVKQSGASAQVATSHPNVDAQLVRQDDRAMITLSNYNRQPVGDIEVLAHLPHDFPHVRTLTGEPVHVTRLDEDTIRFVTRLDRAQAILLADDPAFHGLGNAVPFGFDPEKTHDESQQPSP